MNITDAADICHSPYRITGREPQGVRAASCSAFEFERDYSQPGELERAIGNGYGLALHALDAAARDCRLFMRGHTTTAADVRGYIATARAALDQMERALP